MVQNSTCILLEDPEQKLSLVAHIQEQRACPDARSLTDLPTGGLLEAMLAKEFARGSQNTTAFLELVTVSQSWGDGF